MRFIKNTDTLVFDENIKYPTSLKGINANLLKVAVDSFERLIELEKKIDIDFYSILNISRIKEAVATSAIEGNTIDFKTYSIKKAMPNHKDFTYSFMDKQMMNEENDFYNELIQLEKVTKEQEKKINEPLTDKEIKKIHYDIFSNLENTSSFKSSSAGKYKNTTNYIANGQLITYIPSSVNQLNSEFSKLNKYINDLNFEFINETNLLSNLLIRAAVIHSHFERIHPFNDGNGRVGRLLIPLFLHRNNTTKSACIFLSEEIFKDQKNYYQQLKKVEKEKSYVSFINWFLEIFINFANSFFQRQIYYLLSKNQLEKNFSKLNRVFFNKNLTTLTRIFLTNKYITSHSFIQIFNSMTKTKIDYNIFNQTIIKNLLNINIVKVFMKQNKQIVYESNYFIDNNSNE